METVNIFSIITIAFLGSFGHCIGMCGGIIIAYSSTKIDDDWNRSKQITSHLLYSFGRVTTYIILGAIFGYLGGVAMFNNLANGILLILAAIFMILSGLSLFRKNKILNFN
jgi:sulfite exporter TauE/SafE